ncbi:MAG: cell division protein ZapA [bacterium]
MDDSGRVVKVSIFGHSYPIRAKVEDEEYIRAIAKYVDEKMREIDEAMKPNSTMKVAILTALNVADELMTMRREREDVILTYQEKVQAVSDALDLVLKR